MTRGGGVRLGSSYGEGLKNYGWKKFWPKMGAKYRWGGSGRASPLPPGEGGVRGEGHRQKKTHLPGGDRRHNDHVAMLFCSMHTPPHVLLPSTVAHPWVGSEGHRPGRPSGPGRRSPGSGYVKCAADGAFPRTLRAGRNGGGASPRYGRPLLERKLVKIELKSKNGRIFQNLHPSPKGPSCGVSQVRGGKHQSNCFKMRPLESKHHAIVM